MVATIALGPARFGSDPLGSVVPRHRVPFGALFLVLLPPSKSADEVHHLVRIDQIARGQLVPPLNAQHHAIARVDGGLRRGGLWGRLGCEGLRRLRPLHAPRDP